MEKGFVLIFDEVMLSQLKILGANEQTRKVLSRLLDKMEELGPRAGELIDSHLFLYEMKIKRPPIRLYYWHIKETDELYVFEYELKTSEKKQRKTIQKLRKKVESKSQDPHE